MLKIVNYRLRRLCNKRKKISIKIEKLKFKKFNIQTDIDISKISKRNG